MSRRGREAPCVGGTAAVSADPESDRARQPVLREKIK